MLKGSYDVAKNNISLCMWCNAMCLLGSRFNKRIIFQRADFSKLIVLRSEACSDWPAIPCVVIAPYCIH